MALQAFVDLASMFNGVECERADGMINPEQHTPITDPVFVQTLQIRRKVPQGVMKDFGVRGELCEFLGDVTGRGSIQALERLVKRWSGPELVAQ